MNLFDRLISTEHPESPQLLTVALAAGVLPAVCAGVGLAVIVRIWKHGDIGSGACWALGLSTVTLAVLAGFADRISSIGLAGLIAGGTSVGSVDTPTASAEPMRGAISGGEGSDPGSKSEGAC